MTNQQKSRFCKAYRETYKSTVNHGQAVQAVYDRFCVLYGVTVDVLRGIVAEDVEKHPEEYAQRRKEIANRQNPRAAPKNKRSAPSPKKPKPRNPKLVKPEKAVRTRPTIQLGYGKPAKCAHCGQIMVIHGKKLAKHKLPNGHRCPSRTPVAVREYATCPVCLRRTGIRSSDGRMMSHKNKAGKTCDGTGRSPTEGRKGWHMNEAPIHVIRGGLPGLGRRG